jgi:hypothetical protein
MTDALPNERFQDLVASYGADPDHWPDDLRGGAVRALVESELAREAWRDAADLDAALDSVAGQDLSPDLVENVLAIGANTGKRTPGKFSNISRHAAPYAAAAAIALVVGLAVPSPFRGAPDAGLRTEIAVIEPVIAEETGDSLAALALVDVSSFADDEADGTDTLSDEITLAGIPLL